MGSVEERVRGLVGEAEVSAEGGFSLDEVQARAKLRQFQLPDPRHYVLLVVQAAIQLGATRIDFAIDTDDVHARFDGDVLRAADLERLQQSLFCHDTDPRSRGVRALALAVNAAMALHPRFVRVRSVLDDRGVALELHADGPDALATVPRSADEPGIGPLTTLHVRDRFRPGLVLEFLASLRGEIAEARILREHCRWSPIPVLVDGRPISSSLTLGEDAIVRVAIDRDGFRGEAGFVDEGTLRSADLDARADIVAAGVLVTAHPLPDFPTGFRAIVDAPLLRTDLSHRDIVRDAAYATFVAVLDEAAERALAALADRVLAQGLDTTPRWVPAMLRDALARRGPIDSVHLVKLAAIPLWPTSERTLSTAELRGEPVEYVTRSPARGLPPGWSDVVLAEDIALRRNLLAVFGAHAIDRSEELDTAVEGLAQHDAFLGRTVPRTLAPGSYLGRWWIKTDVLVGEVAIRRASAEDAAIRFLVDGRLLESQRIDRRALPVPGLVAIVEGPFRPRPDWTRAERDDVLADAVLEILRAVHGLAKQEAIAIGDALPSADLMLALRPYLASVARGRFETTFFAAMGFAHETARALMERRGHTSPAIDPASPFGALRMFETTDGRPLCLREIDRERAGGPVRVASDPPPDTPGLVLRVDRDGRRLLEGAFPGAVIVLQGADARPRHDAPAEHATPVDPTTALLDAVRLQLRATDLPRAADAWLDAMEVRARECAALALPDGDTITLNADHPALRLALVRRELALVALVASAVYTAMRTRVRELDDAAQIDWHRRLADRIAVT